MELQLEEAEAAATEDELAAEQAVATTNVSGFTRRRTPGAIAAKQDGTMVGRCMPRHTHQEFFKFLAAIKRAVPPGKIIYVIADHYAAHKHPKVWEWLAEHPRWVFHFTPPSAGLDAISATTIS